LDEQERAAFLVRDHSRRTDVRVLRRRHLEAWHLARPEEIPLEQVDTLLE
jgi:hypothetical protein